MTVVAASHASSRRRRKHGGVAPPYSSCRSVLLILGVLVVGLIILMAANVTVRRDDEILYRNPVSEAKGSTKGHNSEGNDVPTDLKTSHDQQKPKERQDDDSCRFNVRSVRDLQTCYPPQQLRAMPDRECGRITQWADVQRCLSGRFGSTGDGNGRSMKESSLLHYDISLIGERNSGTKFVIQELQKCFRSLAATGKDSGSLGAPVRAALQQQLPLHFPTVKIHRDFHRHKHFFQPLYAGGPDQYRHRIVIALFRDPVEWVAAMREAPYHSPHHVAGYETKEKTGSIDNGSEGNANSPVAADAIKVIPLPWQEFVRRPWTTDRTAADLEILRNATMIRETLRGETCLYRYSVLDATPCLFDNGTDRYPAIPDPLLRGYVPLYELRRDQSQRPFDHVLELRAEKIVNFLIEIPLVYKHLGGYVAARYEDLLRNGTRPLLEEVARIMGMKELPSDCTPTGPQPERLGRRSIPEDFRRWIVQHVDRDLERLLGYEY